MPRNTLRAGSVAALLPAIPLQAEKLFINGDVFLRLTTQAPTGRQKEPVLPPSAWWHASADLCATRIGRRARGGAACTCVCVRARVCVPQEARA